MLDDKELQKKMMDACYVSSEEINKKEKEKKRTGKPLSKKKLKEWSAEGFLYHTLSDEEQKNYDRNRKLIDLTLIPIELEEKIKSEFDNIKVATRDKILNYFISRKLKTLIEIIDEF